MTTSILSRRSLEASPQSLNSSEVTGGSSSSWSNNPHSSLLEQEGDHNGSGGGRINAGLSSNESGFTNPSSLGSMSALLNNAQQSVPRTTGQRNLEQQINENTISTNSAFDQGTSLARLAWLEMDAEIDSTLSSSTIAERELKYKSINSFSNGNTSGSTTFISSCPTYSCARCGTTLALQDELISKAFSGRDGKAFLFFSILNAKVGPKEDRQLLTGLHTVADLSCNTCQRSVGWCYLRAFEASQRYKEGECRLPTPPHPPSRNKADIFPSI